VELKISFAFFRCCVANYFIHFVQVSLLHTHTHSLTLEYNHSLTLTHTHTHTHTDLDIYVPCTHLFILTDLCRTVTLSTITASTLYAYLEPWSLELQYL